MNGARKTAVSGGFTNLKILISGKWSFEKSKFQDIRSFTQISNFTLYTTKLKLKMKMQAAPVTKRIHICCILASVLMNKGPSVRITTPSG